MYLRHFLLYLLIYVIQLTKLALWLNFWKSGCLLSTIISTSQLTILCLSSLIGLCLTISRSQHSSWITSLTLIWYVTNATNGVLIINKIIQSIAIYNGWTNSYDSCCFIICRRIIISCLNTMSILLKKCCNQN